MRGVAELLIGGAIVVFLLDRVLQWMEGRGWIYYRKTKPGRSAIGYHILEMSSAFDPSFKVVQEIQVREESTADDAGDPAGRPHRESSEDEETT